jgi:hypothetical protein
MTPLYLEDLKAIMPSVAILLSMELDAAHKWNRTDEPDPVNQGFLPYQVKVVARTIVCGEQLDDEAYMGGCYYRSNESVGDAQGFLPHMLITTLECMAQREVLPSHVVGQLEAGIKFLHERIEIVRKRNKDIPQKLIPKFRVEDNPNMDWKKAPPYAQYRGYGVEYPFKDSWAWLKSPDAAGFIAIEKRPDSQIQETKV